jgi:hypothetical protein
MGKIFKSRNEVSSTVAPEEPETPGEIKHIEKLSDPDKEVVSEPEDQKPEIEYREVPVCLSDAQINNLIIDNNMMLKQIVSEIEK